MVTTMKKLQLLIGLVALNLASCDRAAPPAQQTLDSETRTSAASTTVTSTTVAPVPTRQSPATTQAAQAPSQHDRLYGTWVARNVDAKMGEVKIQLTFKEDGPVKILAWSDLPFVGQVRDKKAPYEVHGNTISSDAIRGGTSVKYHFDGDDLIIEYGDGKTVLFKRQA